MVNLLCRKESLHLAAPRKASAQIFQVAKHEPAAELRAEREKKRTRGKAT
jgi:hypothetical protein